MSKLIWIILGIISASCRAHFGVHRSDEQLPSQSSPFRKSADVFLRTIGVNPEDHKCFTLARRPFVVSRMVQLPCNKLMPGMPLVRSYIGPFGPICVSYIRDTVYKYYRVPLCCPGFTTDPSLGKCTVRTGNLPPTPQMQQQLGNLMNMASQMRQAMWIKANQDLARKKALILMSMHDRQQRIKPEMSMMHRMVSGMPIMPRFGPKISAMPGIFPGTQMKQSWVTNIPMLPQTLPKLSIAAPIMPRLSMAPPMMPRLPMAPPIMPRLPMAPPMLPRLPMAPPMMLRLPMAPPMLPRLSVAPPMMPRLPMAPPIMPRLPMAPPMLPRLPMAPSMMPRLPMAPLIMPRLPMAPPMMSRIPMTSPMIPRMPMVAQMMHKRTLLPQMMPRMPFAPQMMPRMSMAPDIMPRMPMAPHIIPRMLILSRMPMIPNMTRMPMAPRTPMLHIMPTMPHMPVLPMVMTRPPFSQMFSAYNMNRQPQSRTDFPNFGNPFKPPLSPPFQQPPFSERFVNFMVARPPFPNIPRSNFPALNRPVMMVTRPQHMISKLVLSDGTNFIPLSQMQEFHPPMPSFSQVTRNEQNLSELNSPEFPTIPKVQPQTNPDQPDGFHGEPDFQRDAGPYQETAAPSDGFNATPPPQEAHVTDNIIQENVPDKAAEMPDLMVEQAPSAIAESCIARLDAAVKACLTQNNIDVPDVMSAFEPFNEDKSRVLCKAEDAIFKCITDSLNGCNNSNDADMAREMLMETAQTIKNMCDLRDLSVQDSGVAQDAQNTNGADTVANAENVDALFQESGVIQDVQNTNGADTVATVENVDALSNDVKELPAAHDNDIVAFFEKNGVPQSSAEAFKDAIQQEVHVQELKMKGYLMPILIGSGMGFMILVIFMSILICCCCKRKLKRKMKIAKEVEKPPINDGIYTIGIPPPIYEVNGIPHMYYEEAKGEKITSKSAAILEGTMTKEGADTQM